LVDQAGAVIDDKHTLTNNVHRQKGIHHGMIYNSYITDNIHQNDYLAPQINRDVIGEVANTNNFLDHDPDAETIEPTRNESLPHFAYGQSYDQASQQQ
jgi:hypothetical protein